MDASGEGKVTKVNQGKSAVGNKGNGGVEGGMQRNQGKSGKVEEEGGQKDSVRGREHKREKGGEKRKEKRGIQA